MKPVIFCAIIIIATILFSGCTANQPVQKKIRVVVTIAPLKDFAETIGGDKVEVHQLLPAGADPHSWEPRPTDIQAISNADIFIYIGAGLEPWVGNLPDMGNKSVIEAGNIADLINSPGEDNPSHLETDPHLWLDVGNDMKIMDVMTEEFTAKSPENKAFFAKNSDDYKKKLTAMDDKYRLGLKDCKFQTFIVGGHSAFGYIAHKYGLTQIAVEGLSPDAEPGAQKIAQVIDTINKTGIRYILFEGITTRKVADVLAADTGAKVLVMQTGVADNSTFLQVMDDDLTMLRTALECQ